MKSTSQDNLFKKVVSPTVTSFHQSDIVNMKDDSSDN